MNQIDISRQNYFAAILVQKCWRGHYSRSCIVAFGGAKWTRRLITFQKYCRAFLVSYNYFFSILRWIKCL
ncbi:hypothetical protein EON65_14670 [archaeon]|nr:MAG: hypothetical protein EON65_14670 [archaeon]